LRLARAKKEAQEKMALKNEQIALEDQQREILAKIQEANLFAR
jgi:hypothetical protein